MVVAGRETFQSGMLLQNHFFLKSNILLGPVFRGAGHSVIRGERGWLSFVPSGTKQQEAENQGHRAEHEGDDECGIVVAEAVVDAAGHGSAQRRAQ